MIIPQELNWVEVWTLGRPFHSLYSHIVEVVCDNPGSVGASVVILEDEVRSQIVEIWDRHWLQNLIPISHCIEMAFNDDKPYFASEGDAACPSPTPRHCPHQKLLLDQCNNQHSRRIHCLACDRILANFTCVLPT